MCSLPHVQVSIALLYSRPPKGHTPRSAWTFICPIGFSNSGKHDHLTMRGSHSCLYLRRELDSFHVTTVQFSHTSQLPHRFLFSFVCMAPVISFVHWFPDAREFWLNYLCEACSGRLPHFASDRFDLTFGRFGRLPSNV